MQIKINRTGTTGYPRLPDIVNPLLSNQNVALLRGQAELTASAGLLPVTLESVYRSGAMPGDLAEIHSHIDGAAWRGVTSSIEISFNDGIITMRQDIERL